MKYTLTEETTTAPCGATLYRIVALKDFCNVHKGDKGGFVQSLYNLSQEGDAWVYGDARVYGNALVYGDVRVYGNALVYGDVRVYGNAQVYGDARVSTIGDMVVIGPAKSSGRYTTAHVDKTMSVRVNCGCFTGTIDEFEAAINENHKDSPEHLRQYLSFVAAIRATF